MYARPYVSLVVYSIAEESRTHTPCDEQFSPFRQISYRKIGIFLQLSSANKKYVPKGRKDHYEISSWRKRSRSFWIKDHRTGSLFRRSRAQTRGIGNLNHSNSKIKDPKVQIRRPKIRRPRFILVKFEGRDFVLSVPHMRRYGCHYHYLCHPIYNDVMISFLK